MHHDLLNPTEAHQALRRTVRAIAESKLLPQADSHDRSEQFNLALFRELADLGLLGITISKRFGGAERDATSAVIVYEELSAGDPGFTLSCLSHSILFANNLAACGNEDQKLRYLPDACAGRIVAGMAISETSGGTDVLGMRTTATQVGDSYVLNGEKMWITNGVVLDGMPGDVFLVYARTSDQGPRGLTLFLVPKEADGFRVSDSVHGRLGVRASPSAQLVFRNCRIPVRNRVGEVGGALRSMMRTLEMERLTMAAMSLGIARKALELMNQYATSRSSFQKPLRQHGQIQRYLSDSYAEWMAGRAYVYSIASRVGHTATNNSIDADAVKLYCSTMAKNVADRAIQVLGAYGYSGRSPVARLWRDAKLFEIGGGTIEAHQRNVSRQLQGIESLL